MSKTSKRAAHQFSTDTLGFCLVSLSVCLVFGGGTKTLEIGDVFAEAICLPLIVISLLRMRVAPLGAIHKAAMAIGALIIATPLLQLIPLPPDVWTKLPGRRIAFEGFRLSGAPIPWLGVSLVPNATRQSAFSLLPPLAVFLTATRLNRFERRLALGALLAFGIATAMLGLFQIAAGPGSPLRVYYPEDSDAVGLFANRNHFAALLYVCLLIATSWWPALLLQMRNSETSRRRPPWGFLWLQAIGIGIVLLGIVISQSRAGLLLSIAAVLLGLASVAPIAMDRQGLKALTIGALVIVLIMGVTSDYALYAIWARISSTVGIGERAQIAAITKSMISETFPWGTGFGSFVPTYAAHETATNSISAAVNRAHDDFLEWTLEGGILSLVTIAAGLVWLVRASARALRPAENDDVVDSSLGRAASFVPFLLLGHSLIDYPLRTVALMGVAALAAGVTIGNDES